jgi:hypothetical protein
MENKGFYTIPWTVKEGIESNIFVMSRDLELQKKSGVKDEVIFIQELHEWKVKMKTFESEGN